MKHLYLSLLVTIYFQLVAQNVVYLEQDLLAYTSDEKENIVPDWSYVGYHNGEKLIPNISVVKTISPISGDNYEHIQNAIQEVEALPQNADGIRGALLLAAGTYKVSNTLVISKSGVVLRGEGQNTILIATKKAQHTLIEVKGKDDASKSSSSKTLITDSYVPLGAKSFTVASGHSFKVGDNILVERVPNQAWIDLIGTGTLSQTDPNDTDWTPNSYTLAYKRNIVAIDGNKLTIDAPIVDYIDNQYAKGYVYTYTWDDKIEEVGVESMRLESEYTNETDEEHGWRGVSFINAENSWMQYVDAYYFGYSCVNVESSSNNITVQNCKMIDPKSKTTGGRKYSFDCDGQRNLFKNCYAKGGRHDYVSGSRVPGPNVFVGCESENQLSVTGPHHRWATGQLYDNVIGTENFAAEWRGTSGSGHGWSGSQIMFWNCTGATFIIQSPPGDHVNWCIGCTGTISNESYWGTKDLGVIESTNQPVIPSSLYDKQLAERLILQNINIQKPYFESSITIPGMIELENFDKGGQYISYLDNTFGNASKFYRSESVDINQIDNTSNKYFIGRTQTGEWLEYTIDVQKTGDYDFTLMAASNNVDGGGIHFEIDNIDITGRFQVDNTEGWQTFTPIKASNIYLKKGKQILRVYIEEGGVNLDKVSIEPSVISGTNKILTHPINIYPNPASDKLHIELNQLASSVEIYSSQGILQLSINSISQETIDVSSYDSGIYTVKAIIQNKTFTHSFIVK